MTEVKKDLQRSISAMEKTVCSLIKPKTAHLKNEREHERQQRLQQQQMQQQPQHVQQTQADTIGRGELTSEYGTDTSTNAISTYDDTSINRLSTADTTTEWTTNDTSSTREATANSMDENLGLPQCDSGLDLQDKLGTEIWSSCSLIIILIISIIKFHGLSAIFRLFSHL